MRDVLRKMKTGKRVGILMLVLMLAIGTMTVSAEAATNSGDNADEMVMLTIGVSLDNLILEDVVATFEITTGYELTSDDMESFVDVLVAALDGNNIYKLVGVYDTEAGEAIGTGYVVNGDATLVVMLETIQSTPKPTPKPEEEDPINSVPPTAENEKPIVPDTPEAPDTPEKPTGTTVTSPKMGEPTLEGWYIAMMFAVVAAVGYVRTKKSVR